MWNDAHTVFLIIAVAAGLMASNRLRFDIIAILVVLTLVISGVLSVSEALAGFGSPVVILVAGLLVVGEMLDRTGVAIALGNWLLRHGGHSEPLLYVLLMCSTAALGMVMSSTAVVAIFIPIVLRIAAETGQTASRLLMPMSYAALVSGMLTLIATTPNLVVSEELKVAGYEGLGFFSFTPVGLAILAVTIGYILIIRRSLLPSRDSPELRGASERSMLDIWEEYCGQRSIFSCRIGQDSSLVGQRIDESNLDPLFGLRILAVRRPEGVAELIVASPPSAYLLGADDELLIAGTAEDVDRAAENYALSTSPVSRSDFQRWSWELGSATALVHPESAYLGKSLRESAFRSQYALHVLGLRRAGEPVNDLLDTQLAPSDSLLLMGPWKHIDALRAQHSDFVVKEVSAERAGIVPAYRQMPVALGILALMVLLTLFDIVPLVVAVLAAALAAVFTRILTMEDAYRCIHWSSIVLVAGMLPLADALEKTGGTDLVVESLMYAVGDASPRLMLSVLFFLTATLGLFLSNTASAVLVAPVAIIAAETLGISPYPLAVTVLIAASAAFVTPFSTPVVTLVVEPGRYRFADFVKVGIPLVLLVWLTSLLVIPLIFPFHPSVS